MAGSKENVKRGVDDAQFCYIKNLGTRDTLFAIFIVTSEMI